MLVNKQYGLINLPIPIGMGNVLTTVSDRKLPHTSDNITIDYYTADITSAQDYYAFGMLMPGRNWSSNSYRFGFNGKENDNEVTGVVGSFQDYGMRMYDTRVCRFISVDPLSKKYPMLSTFQFAGNTPIIAIDIDGTEPLWSMTDESRAIQNSYNIIYGEGSAKANEYYQAYISGRAAGSLIGVSVGIAIASAAEIGIVAAVKSMVTMGVVVGTIKGTISAVKGEPASEVAKSCITGFASGMMLGLSPSTALPSLLSTGFVSGMVGEYASQVIDNEFGEGSGYNIDEMIATGGIDAVTNLIGGKIIEGGSKFIDKQVKVAIKKIYSNENRNAIIKEIRSKVPSATGQGLKDQINTMISEQIILTKAQGELNKKMLEFAVESSEKTIENIVEEK